MSSPDADVPVLGAEPVTVVVVAGGSATRFGGDDKLASIVQGQSVLDWVLDAWSFANEQIVVGPVRPTRRPVRWCREQPPGGGPAAAVSVALPFATCELVGLAAGDAPLVGPVVSELRAAAVLSVEAGDDGAWLVGSDGTPQPLATIARKSALQRVLHDAVNASITERLSQLKLHTVPVRSDTLHDVDTPEDHAFVSELLANYLEGEPENGANKGADDE